MVWTNLLICTRCPLNSKMSVHGLLAEEVEENTPIHKLFPWLGNLTGFFPLPCPLEHNPALPFQLQRISQALQYTDHK